PTLRGSHVGMTIGVATDADGSNTRALEFARGDETKAVNERTRGLGTIARDDEAALDARLRRRLLQIGFEFLERRQAPRGEVGHGLETERAHCLRCRDAGLECLTRQESDRDRG